MLLYTYQGLMHGCFGFLVVWSLVPECAAQDATLITVFKKKCSSVLAGSVGHDGLG